MDPIVLLDTHVLVRMVLDRRQLTRIALRAIQAARQRLVADISLREIAMLSHRGVIILAAETGDWLASALEEFSVEVVAIDPRIASRSVHIAENFHGDPADQLIAATAIELQIPLVTADEKLRASPALRTIW